jgi:aspartyl/asparaginyl beta-hydroxylase (cupin superfamily)
MSTANIHRTATPFFHPESFPWTEGFVENFDTVRREIEGQIRGMTPVYPEYTEALSDKDSKRGLWFTSTMLFFTIKNQSVTRQMPQTWKLLEGVPGLVTAMLARMEGGVHLKAHCGYSPDTVRCHFGAIVPEPNEVILRVDTERRTWAPKQWLIFDDYLEHEVWHHGTKSRTVLLVDVVRPGVPKEPRRIAEDFFERVPGTRFDEQLESVAPAEKWLEWLRAGTFF